MSHQYIFAIVRKVLNGKNKDVIGNDPFLVLGQLYAAANLDLFSVPDALKDVIHEDDFFVADYVSKEVLKIIRNTTKDQIDNIYKDIAQKIESVSKKSEDAGMG